LTNIEKTDSPKSLSLLYLEKLHTNLFFCQYISRGYFPHFFTVYLTARISSLLAVYFNHEGNTEFMIKKSLNATNKTPRIKEKSFIRDNLGTIFKPTTVNFELLETMDIQVNKNYLFRSNLIINGYLEK